MILFLILPQVFALCNETQIDINSAPKEELMKITGLGGKGIIAQRVIDARPFDNIDDLIKVKGIGNKTLDKIKTQGLACVNESSQQIQEQENLINNEMNETEQSVEIEEQNISQSISQTFKTQTTLSTNQKTKTITLETINLNTKDIKIKNDKKYLNKSNYAIYGFIAFCILLGILFLVKKNKKYKTEFEE